MWRTVRLAIGWTLVILGVPLFVIPVPFGALVLPLGLLLLFRESEWLQARWLTAVERWPTFLGPIARLQERLSARRAASVAHPARRSGRRLAAAGARRRARLGDSSHLRLRPSRQRL